MCNTIMERPTFDSSKILKENAMLKVRPELFNEWDFEKNSELEIDIYEVTKGSKKKVWWICPKCISSYDSPIDGRCRGKGRNCPYCAGKRVNNSNSLAGLRPYLIDQWHPKLNGDLTPHDVTYKSDKRAWWICHDCNSIYDMDIRDKSNDLGCPYCSGHRTNNSNSLATLNPNIASEWHPILNEDLTPDNVTPNSHIKVWWQCSEHETHVWNAIVKSRNNGSGCPYCSNRKVLKGFNDIHTTNNKLFTLLANQEDGYKYSEWSSKRIDWKCLDCGEIIRNKRIRDINSDGLSCPLCSDGKSYPEKFMSNLLKQLNINFINDVKTNWSNDKRYDFVINDFNMIIETHGDQHKNGGFKTMGGNSLEKEIENDKYKKSLAFNNGIKHYIEIDCSVSELDYIRNNILKSDLAKFFNLDSINWLSIDEKSNNSLCVLTLEMWNNGNKDVNNIAEELSVDPVTIRSYLKKWNKVGRCDLNDYDKRIRKIVQLNLDGSVVNEFDSTADAKRELSLNSTSSISMCLNGKFSTGFGFRWMYKDEYEKKIEKEGKITPDYSGLYTSVVKLTLDGKFIEEFSSMKEAANSVKKGHGNISACCRGANRVKSAYGYRWMYKGDYENYIKQNNKES